MLKKSTGFNLVELMAVLALIALLGAIALPSYKLYIQKARVGKVLMLTKAWVDEITTNYMRYGSWPSKVNNIAIAVGGAKACATFDDSNKGGNADTTQLCFTATTTSIMMEVTLSSTLDNALLVQTMTDSGTGALSMQCGSRPTIPKFFPVVCQAVL